MNLLFTRSQHHSRLFSLVPLRIGGSVTFKLKAELELTEEENTLLYKYAFENSTLIYSNAYDDLARAFKPAWFCGLFMMIVPLFGNYSSSKIQNLLAKLTLSPLFGILTVIIMTMIYFFALRKNITVSQLLDGGRTFLCHSVVDLDEQEAELNDLARRLHATLEKAKNWGGREINPIPEGEPFYLPDAQFQQQHPIQKDRLYTVGLSIRKFIKSLLLGKKEQAISKKLEVNKAPAAQPTPQPTAPTTQLIPQSTATPNPAQAQPPKTETAAHPLAPKPTDPPSSGS